MDSQSGCREAGHAQIGNKKLGGDHRTGDGKYAVMLSLSHASLSLAAQSCISYHALIVVAFALGPNLSYAELRGFLLDTVCPNYAAPLWRLTKASSWSCRRPPGSSGTRTVKVGTAMSIVDIKNHWLEGGDALLVK